MYTPNLIQNNDGRNISKQQIPPFGLGNYRFISDKHFGYVLSVIRLAEVRRFLTLLCPKGDLRKRF